VTTRSVIGEFTQLLGDSARFDIKWLPKHGDLLVSTNDENDHKQVMGIKSVGGKPVRTHLPISGIVNRGVIRQVPVWMSGEEIESELKAQNYSVEKVEKYGQRVAVIHFAAGVSRPVAVRLQHWHPVSDYEEKPMQCFRCFRFGHMSGDCHGKETCLRCGLRGHKQADCKYAATAQRCVNCGGAHQPKSAACTVRQREIYVHRTAKHFQIPRLEAVTLIDTERAAYHREQAQAAPPPAATPDGAASIPARVTTHHGPAAPGAASKRPLGWAPKATGGAKPAAGGSDTYSAAAGSGTTQGGDDTAQELATLRGLVHSLTEALNGCRQALTYMVTKGLVDVNAADFPRSAFNL
jgi:hypothetical protein